MKCKMCGGDLEFDPGSSVCTCEFCGSTNTLPKQDDENKLKLFARANRLRSNNEFDKAAVIYEQIVSNFPEEAEAYWGLCLCKFGIEYVEDTDGTRKPTCHRTIPTSIFEDDDFEQAQENADNISRATYREEAKEIDQIQQRILEISSKEPPYDVFICYKETDENGERTEDSVLAQDIYDALTNKKLKVFFARITLEDKLGQEYEPYIYSALNTAKVMLVVGTEFDYFNAVWVKNEWARYLDMMSRDRSKTLIPCYKGIDAYDMPKEFKNLQAQDMGKLGWLQDLTRGVEKLCGVKEKEKPTAQQQIVFQGGSTVDSLLHRAELFLEDGRFQEASQYADKILDINYRYARAYILKLCAKLKCKSIAAMANLAVDFSSTDEYHKAMRFGTDEEITEFTQLSDSAKENKKRLEEERNTKEREKQHQKEKEKREELVRNLEPIIKVLNRKKDQTYAQAKEKKKAAEEALIACQQSMDTTLAGIKSRIEEQQKKVKQLLDDEGSIKKKVEELEAQIASLSGLRKMTQGGPLKAQLEKAKEEMRTHLHSREDAEKTLQSSKTSEISEKERFEKQIAALKQNVEECVQHVESARKTIADSAVDVDAFISAPFFFGNIETESGKEPIEWKILKVESHRMLILSSYGITAHVFHEGNAFPGWANSTIREWLNSEFISNTFNEEEQSLIGLEPVITYIDTEGDRTGTTKDKVFLLSTEEVEHYFPGKSDRKLLPSVYASSHGVHAYNGEESEYKVDGRGCCWWWLRSPAYDKRLATCVYLDGGFVNRTVNAKVGAVRPAMWLTFDDEEINNNEGDEKQ